jgi:hypothetical protein
MKMLLKNLKKTSFTISRTFFPDAFKTGDFSLIVNEQNIREAINSFPAGSSPGLDGMRPQYLKDIISLSAGEAGQRALRALTKLQFFIVWPTSFRNLSFIIWCVFMRPS